MTRELARNPARPVAVACKESIGPAEDLILAEIRWLAVPWRSAATACCSKPYQYPGRSFRRRFSRMLM